MAIVTFDDVDRGGVGFLMAVLGRLDRDWQGGCENGLSYWYTADAVER